MSPLYVNSTVSSNDLKQKEKQMAAINCTGVSAAFGKIWKCKPCGDMQHQGKEDCYYYKVWIMCKSIRSISQLEIRPLIG